MSEQTANSAQTGLEPRSVVRARQVLRQMEDVFPELGTEDVNFLKGLPTMLKQNGLGQTLAYLVVKMNNDDGYRHIFNIMAGLLFTENEVDITKPKAVMEYILNMDTIQKYTLKQEEAMLYSVWMKKFAVAFHGQTRNGG